MTKVETIVARLLKLHPRLIDLALDRMVRLLAKLDHPQRRLPPVIHVAGTNGKGSTIAFMRAILEAAGRCVHVYTSPHLVSFKERFRLGKAGGGRLVTEAELASTLVECEDRNEGAPITVFEIETAAAFLLFARHPADVLLLEVGLGGRFDATNVIDRPLATVITPVSLDHAELLGDTLAKIAAEKAGILKRDVPAIVAAQQREAAGLVEKELERVSGRNGEVAIHVRALLALAAAVVADLDLALVQPLVQSPDVVVVQLVLGDELVEPGEVQAALALCLCDQGRDGFLEMIAHDLLVSPIGAT